MAYYTLLTKADDGKFYPQFGDYDRQVVVDEKRDCYKGEKAVIVRSVSARQSEVIKAIRYALCESAGV